MTVGRERGDSLKGEHVVVLYNRTKEIMNKSIVKAGSSFHKKMSNKFIGDVVCTLECPIRKRMHKL
ncbi:hypothetical protein BEH94_04155 [Candidatus Altiarchaeales archaeon WOR_SM1_SCG]|nr:hypothetical protein BEH94_04155 [Candidatus Altiarchaeales archaeon WOR_SM1_SCG]